MRCFIEGLSLDIHSDLDIFLHGSIAHHLTTIGGMRSVTHELLGRKSAPIIWCI